MILVILDSQAFRGLVHCQSIRLCWILVLYFPYRVLCASVKEKHQCSVWSSATPMQTNSGLARKIWQARTAKCKPVHPLCNFSTNVEMVACWLSFTVKLCRNFHSKTVGFCVFKILHRQYTLHGGQGKDSPFPKLTPRHTGSKCLYWGKNGGNPEMHQIRAKTLSLLRQCTKQSDGQQDA